MADYKSVLHSEEEPSSNEPFLKEPSCKETFSKEHCSIESSSNEPISNEHCSIESSSNEPISNEHCSIESSSNEPISKEHCSIESSSNEPISNISNEHCSIESSSNKPISNEHCSIESSSNEPISNEHCSIESSSNEPISNEHCSSESSSSEHEHCSSEPYFNEPSCNEPSLPLSRIGLKAGMEGLDTDRINKIILEASIGSKYYKNELRKDQEIMKRVNQMLRDLRTFTAAQKSAALRIANREAEEMELSRDLSHIIVHVDMDAFYAAVEARDNPSWKDVPMAVGSNSMLSTSNYVARRFGVRAAMPGFIATKLCPDLIIVSPHFDKYCHVSMEVKKILSEYDPNFCPMGLDESYLDLTEFVNEKMRVVSSPHDCPDTIEVPLDEGIKSVYFIGKKCLSSKWRCAERVVEELRAKILETTGLTASGGIAPNKEFAKIASDMNKPNGQFTVEPTREGVMSFIQELPIRKVCGIGKVTEKMLNALGVTICRDLYEKRDIIRLVFSPSSSRFFLSISLGLGCVEVQRTSDRKGISTERSFDAISDPVQQMEKCLELCTSLAEDMANENIKGCTVTLKLKTVDFVVRTQALTVSRPVSTCKELYAVARQLLQRVAQPAPLKLRLMGVRVTSLKTSKQQESLRSFFRPLPQNHGQDVAGDLQSATVAIEPTKSDHNSTKLISGVCPVCGAKVSTNNQHFNQHLDECLNRSAIREAVEEFEKPLRSFKVENLSNCKRARIISADKN